MCRGSVRAPSLSEVAHGLDTLAAESCWLRQPLKLFYSSTKDNGQKKQVQKATAGRSVVVGRRIGSHEGEREGLGRCEEGHPSRHPCDQRASAVVRPATKGVARVRQQAVGVGANTAAPAVETARTLEELAANLHSEWFESVGEGGTWGGSDGDGASGATPGTAPKTQCRKGVCGWSCEME